MRDIGTVDTSIEGESGDGVRVVEEVIGEWLEVSGGSNLGPNKATARNNHGH